MTTDPLARLREACEYLDGPGWEDPQAQNAFEGVVTPRIILALLDELSAARAVVEAARQIVNDTEDDDDLATGWIIDALAAYDATIAKRARDEP